MTATSKVQSGNKLIYYKSHDEWAFGYFSMNTLGVLEKGMSTYCESGVGLFSTQPINTISNIALLISAYFAYQFIKTNRVKNVTIRALPLILVATGAGSIFWHGIPNPLTGFSDTLPLSIFVLVSFFFLLNKLLPNRGLVWKTLFVFMLIEIPFIFGILPSFNGFLPYLIVLTLGMFIFFGLAKKYKSLLPQLVIIIVLFVIAFFFRTIDHPICSTLPVGTHFIWHILNALVFYLLIRSFVAIDRVKGLFPLRNTPQIGTNKPSARNNQGRHLQKLNIQPKVVDQKQKYHQRGEGHQPLS